ncbi:histone deacetylase 6 isoform X2 [Triticum urartu]|uniref:histone deacetylase 6 isoform X2 n=1 Tax=Triticum urartu TaxID=4572 RepID=UPI0020435AF6|nr:histone deacetylase 6 isoform X2 [Triticum urartu]
MSIWASDIVLYLHDSPWPVRLVGKKNRRLPLHSDSPRMSSAAGAGEHSSSSRPVRGKEREEGTDDINRKVDDEGDLSLELYGAEAGWVEARTSCPHLPAMPAASADELARVPAPDSHCSRCHHPSENWLCLICKDVLCSRFINKHMLCHYQETGHCIALSFSDLSVWCFACDSYLDAQSILELLPVYEVAHLLKFGERPPFRSLEVLDLSSGQNGGSSSSS